MLRDALADSKSFLTQAPAIPTNDDRTPCSECHLLQQQVPSITFTLIVIQYCIFYLIIPMHFSNKYMIFTHLLYIFAGTHSNGEIAH